VVGNEGLSPTRFVDELPHGALLLRQNAKNLEPGEVRHACEDGFAVRMSHRTYAERLMCFTLPQVLYIQAPLA
jgi:hypothetical protein